MSKRSSPWRIPLGKPVPSKPVPSKPVPSKPVSSKPVSAGSYILNPLEAAAPNWKEVIENNLLSEYGIRLKFERVLGSGAFGVVYATSDPNYVFKITTDLYESHILEEIRITQKGELDRTSPPTEISFLTNDDNHVDPVALVFRRGFVRVFFVGAFRDIAHPLVPGYGQSCYYLVIRENVQPDYDQARFIETDYADILPDGATCPITPHTITAQGQRITLCDSEDWLRDWEAALIHDNKLERIAKIVADLSNSAPNIAEVLQYYLENGRVMADLHAGNIARRIRPQMVWYGLPMEGIGDFVISDPGLTRPIQASSRDSIRRINPARRLSTRDRIIFNEIASRCDGWFD